MELIVLDPRGIHEPGEARNVSYHHWDSKNKQLFSDGVTSSGKIQGVGLIINYSETTFSGIIRPFLIAHYN